MDATPAGSSSRIDDAMMQLWRELTPELRMLHISYLHREVRETVMELLRTHCPTATEAELRCRYAAAVYGRDLAAKVYGWDPGDDLL